MGETITYAPYKVIKSQALADFVAEWTDTQLPQLRFKRNFGRCTSMDPS